MQDKHWLAIGIVSLVITISGGLIYSYFTLFDGTWIRPVVQFYEPQNDTGAYLVQTEKIQYHTGEEVFAYFHACKYRNIAADIQWTLANDRLWFYVPQKRTVGTIGCWQDIPLLVPLEKIFIDYHPGPNHFNGVAKYYVNPFRTLTFTFQTNDFEVIK